MILIHILTTTKEQYYQIADLLIKENLLLEATIHEKVISRIKDENGEIASIEKTLMTGKTKALLFNSIDEIIKKHYPDNPPVLYATPIVQMEWEQSRRLLDNVAKV